MTNFLKNYFKDWNLFEKIWLVSFTLVNLWLFYTWHDTWMGLIASLSGMICVVLVAKGKISNYYFGFVNIVTYAYIAYQNQYYGDFMLNAYFYFPMQFVGLYLWIKHRDDKKTKDDIVVNHISTKEKFLWFAICVIGVLDYGLYLNSIGGRLPFVDSFTTVLSVVATFLMTKRVSEQWLLWILVDIVSIYMWVYRIWQGGTDISMIVMWVAFLINAIYGYYNWRKMGKQNGSTKH
jgi:nicotinamide mononucleotide transporter